MTNDGEYTYSFDANNMIKDVDGGSTGVYKYDVNGQRVMKAIGSETIYYVFGVGQYSSVSGWDKTYVHLGRHKLLEYSSGTTYFYGTDHLATPRIQTSMSAAVMESWSSYPYGEEWEQSGPGTEENRFTGHLFDPETNQYYAGARFLDQKSRWLSADPARGNGENPQRVNHYSYVLNDPINLVDSDGATEKGPHTEITVEAEAPVEEELPWGWETPGLRSPGSAGGSGGKGSGGGGGGQPSLESEEEDTSEETSEPETPNDQPETYEQCLTECFLKYGSKLLPLLGGLEVSRPQEAKPRVGIGGGSPVTSPASRHFSEMYDAIKDRLPESIQGRPLPTFRGLRPLGERTANWGRFFGRWLLPVASVATLLDLYNYHSCRAGCRRCLMS